jgi:ubiquitin-conjugating enzyme E2 J1
MASQSRAWKCAACAKTNLEILTDCEIEAAKLTPDAKKPDEAVPKELKMGWRDEMSTSTGKVGTGKAEPSTNGIIAGDEDADRESDELAEGFVQTAPMLASSNGLLAADAGPGPQQAQAQTLSATYPAARPAHSVPQPTATMPLPPAPAVQLQQLQQRRRQSNDGVPEWVDKAIVGIVACLIVMILKMLLGL